MKRIAGLLLSAVVLNSAEVYCRDTRKIFTYIYETNFWDNEESAFGPGSTVEQTRVIRELLPILFIKYNIKTVLDVPCGDFNWMQHVDMSSLEYVGMDICIPLIRSNQQKHRAANRLFMAGDLVTDVLPQADLIICRDCLQHLTFEQTQQAVRNMKRSGSTYLLTTTHTNWQNNVLIATGNYYPINVQAAPFNFPAPLLLVNEQATDGENEWLGKSVGLWLIADLPDFEKV